MTDSAVVNFRMRTGQARRARTRAKILSTAFALFDQRGVDQVTVEDVRALAGLARGSFYNDIFDSRTNAEGIGRPNRSSNQR